MGSRSKQGPESARLPVGSFVTCDECKVKRQGTFDELVEFLEKHRREHSAHEVKIWIPVERWG